MAKKRKTPATRAVVRMWIPCRLCYALVEAWSYSVPRPMCSTCDASGLTSH